MTKQKRWLLAHPQYGRLYVQLNKEKINLRRRKEYKKNKCSYIEKNRVRLSNGTLFIRNLKNVPCLDCGARYPHYIMHFDHRDPKLKVRSLSEMSTYSTDAILKEASKCDIVCANCHAERTHKGIETGKIKVFGKYYV